MANPSPPLWLREDLPTAAAAFAEVARHHPDNAAIAVPARPGRDYHADGVEWRYTQAQAAIDALAAAYAGGGYGHGHRIAVLMENRPEFVLHMLALNALGACVVPVNPDYRRADLEYLLGHAEVDLVVTLAHRTGDLGAAADAVPGRPSVVPVEAVRPDGLAPARRPAAAGAPGRDTPSLLLYTSGTTGLPKGCLIDNEYFFFTAERYLTAGGKVDVRFGRERLFNPLPMFYANSTAISNMAMIMSGNCMIFPDRFHPSTWWRDIVATRATCFHYLGLIPPVLLNQPSVPEERGHAVRFATGAGIDPAIHGRFEERFGVPLVDGWGMSEVAIAAWSRHEPRKIDTRSIGTPLAGMEFRVVDDDDRPVPDGTPGELLVRRIGPDPKRGLMREYFRAPEITAETWRNGWFHTGDIVRRDADADGHYHFVDRKKHMIRRSGQNIAAAEIENCLLDHPGVRTVACMPVPDEVREEEVMACVDVADGHAADRATAEAIQRHALANLAYFKAPGWVLFLDDLPKTATQKLQKSAIFAKDEDPRTRAGVIDLRDGKQRRAQG